MIGARTERAGGTIAADSLVALLLKVLLAGVGLGASVLISRGLGPEGRGEYYGPIVAAATLVAAGKLGLEQANVFLFGALRLPVARLQGQNGLIACGMGIVGVLALVLAAPVLPAVFGETPILSLVLAALTIPFSLHTQFTAGLLTLLGRVTWQFRAALVAGVAQIGVLLALWALGWLDVGSVLAANLATLVLTWGLTLRGLGGDPGSWIRWDAELLRQTLRQSLALHVGMLLFFLQLRLDMFMVRGMLGAAALGHYSLAVVLAESVLLVADSLAVAVLPRQIEAGLADSAQLALRGARMTLLLGVALAALWILLGAPVIRYAFGRAFGPAYLPLVGLMPGMIFLGMQRMCGGPVLRTGRPGRVTAIYAAALGCNAGLNLWCIPALGPVGAALASTASYGLGAWLFLGWTAQLAGASLAASLRPTRDDLACLWQAVGAGARSVGRLGLRRGLGGRAWR